MSVGATATATTDTLSHDHRRGLVERDRPLDQRVVDGRGADGSHRQQRTLPAHLLQDPLEVEVEGLIRADALDLVLTELRQHHAHVHGARRIALLTGDRLDELAVEIDLEVREVEGGIVGVNRGRRSQLLQEPEVVLVLAAVEGRGDLVAGVHLVIVDADREGRLRHPHRIDDHAVLVDGVVGRGGAEGARVHLFRDPAAHREEEVLPRSVRGLDGRLEEPVLAGHDGRDDIELARIQQGDEVRDEDDVDEHAVLALLDDAVGTVGVRDRDGVARIGGIGVDHQAEVTGAQGRRADRQETNALEER